MSKRAPRYDVPKTAPEDLRLVQLFVNTAAHETGRELLSSPRELGIWLAQHDLLSSKARVTNADLNRATALREALRGLLRANNHGEPDAAAADEVNRIAGRSHIEIRASPAGTSEVAVAGRGVDGALGRIVAHALAAMLDGRWRRLKTKSPRPRP